MVTCGVERERMEYLDKNKLRIEVSNWAFLMEYFCKLHDKRI